MLDSYYIHINSEVGVQPKHHRITLHQKPDGEDGEWRIWTETITFARPEFAARSTSGMPMNAPRISNYFADDEP